MLAVLGSEDTVLAEILMVVGVGVVTYGVGEERCSCWRCNSRVPKGRRMMWLLVLGLADTEKVVEDVSVGTRAV